MRSPVVTTKSGHKFVRLAAVQVPLALALGRYEALTDEELDEHYHDIRVERSRRTTKDGDA